ncbi:MAG TPA: hypothetical protein VNW15_11665 [Rhizomicrobium sp.]|jgi:hypothetical protein|nr:hypothetical protein [Rhizomicrobium sp.]
MILDWLKPKKIQTEDTTTFDADGELLRTYDDVTLLQEVPTDSIPEELRFFRGTIPAGTIGTIIIIDINSSEALVHLEFNIDHQLAFAHATGNHVRLHRRREEKLKHA